MKFFLQCFCLVITFTHFEAFQLMGPLGNLSMNSIYACDEKPANDDVSVHAEIKTLDEKGNKAMYATLTNKIPIDETFEHSIAIQKWEGGGWNNYYNVKGKVCADLTKLLPKVWLKLRSVVKPPMSPSCLIKPDKYVLDNFQITNKDLTFPAIFYGRFKVKVQVFKNKKLMCCLQGEGVSEAP